MIKKFAKSFINKINEADIRDFVPGADSTKLTSYVRCPECGKEGRNKGLKVSKTQKFNGAKCFSCQFALGTVVKAVEYYNNCNYPQAVQKIADNYGWQIEYEEQPEPSKEMEESQEKSLEGSFLMKQLLASGLTLADVQVKIPSKDGRSVLEHSLRKGGVRDGKVNNLDDEMLIYYYDLYGNLVMYPTRGATGGMRPYVRVRWSHPESHKDAQGKPYKYMTPKGAQSRFYFPQRIRDLFSSRSEIPTLYIQEGEKKAEKACKHGLPSIGIQGISNIGTQDSGLLPDLQYLAQKCNVRNIVLVFDSDWNNLHSSLQPGDHADQRPNAFYKAALKFKTYVETLHAIGVDVDVWVAHINDNEAGDKGMDDLLVNTLNGREAELLEDVTLAMKAHDGKGKYLDFFKISSMTDYNIAEIWSLKSRDKFFSIHRERLLPLKTFRFSKVLYSVRDGEFVKSSVIGSDKEFWSVETSDKGKRKGIFYHTAALDFIAANNYRKIHTVDMRTGEFGFVKVEDKVLTSCSDQNIRDFVYWYVRENCKDSTVLDMFSASIKSLLDFGVLQNLPIIYDDFVHYDQYSQDFFYKNGQCRISAQGIEFGPRMSMVWEDNVIRRDFHRVQVIKDVSNVEGQYYIDVTEEGCKCEFLQYIYNTSNFWARKGKVNEAEMYHHIVNKLLAIGFLLTDFNYPTERKAVVAMDSTMSEVGKSNGRSGKSLLGAAIAQMKYQTFVEGKKLAGDQFAFTLVTPKTRSIIFDDVNVNFDFTQLYSILTSKLIVNQKQGAIFEIPVERSPKFIITTNHAINNTDSSTLARITFLSFSDYYNPDFSPNTEFGHNFFDDWDDAQWILFDNLMAECVALYLKSRELGWAGSGKGMIDPPMENIQLRTLRQQMGEVLLQWGEAYFDQTGEALNRRLKRSDMYENFCTEYPGQRSYISSASFKNRLEKFCAYKGLHINPHKKNKSGFMFTEWSKSDREPVFVGERDSSGGKEYIIVATTEFAESTMTLTPNTDIK